MDNVRNFYINGQWTDPVTSKDLDVVNPATEEVVATISLGDQPDTNAAVAAAKAAFATWSETTADTRLVLLEKLLEIYNERSEEMAQAMTIEMGVPITKSRRAQVVLGKIHLKATIEALRSFEFESVLGKHAPRSALRREPIGVAALITPWNWPMNQVMLKVAPALAVGCTVVLKPSELAPLSSILLTEMIDDAAFPPGVFNMVNGDGVGVGSQLSSHPDIDMVSFTGSTRAGTAISQAAADTIKRVSLELGGKGANIVFANAAEDAPIIGVKDCLGNSGQSCNAPARMLVERSIYAQTNAKVKAATESLIVGQPDDEDTQLGPVVSESQYNKIQALIKSGIDEGATLLVGGLGKPDGLETGFFVRPTIFTDVTPSMTVATEEIFGPVMTITPFDSEEEAIHIANDTVYGLANYVQTSDPEQARRVARKLRSGMVSINDESFGSAFPFGGYGQSGNGREGGKWGLEEFTEIKVISGYFS